LKIEDLKKKFIEIYGGVGNDLRVFASPGRVNLIGEHTDYNGGFVFPAALTMQTTLVLRTRNDRNINLIATDLECKVNAHLDKLDDYKELRWGNYQLGVADELQKVGYTLLGCDILYHDTIPHRGGLSSSAAIEVSTAIALITLSNEAKGITSKIDLIEMAKICQKAENNYVGVNCGIMDQFASAMGKANHAIFLNCKDLSYKLIRLNLNGYRLVISNTNLQRSLTRSNYNERRSECEQGLEILKTVLKSVTCLGDISYNQFIENKHLIVDETIRRRVEHVIAEDERVLESIEALENDDIAKFGRLMVQSHNSLRDLYEVTGNELDTLVEEAMKICGVAGSRMTGAGFGGCTVSIVSEDALDNFIEQVGEKYYMKTGINASFYVSDVGDGAREIK